MTSVCEVYHYKLEDFFRKHFYQGGLTKKQLTTLFEHHQKRRISMLEFQAKIHGAKIKGEPVVQEEKSDISTFKSPQEYELLSPEEKKALTERMKGIHKNHEVLGIGVKKRGDRKNA